MFGGSGLLDPEIARDPLERLLVGVVLLPAGEIADMLLLTQQPHPPLALSSVGSDRR